MTSLHDDASSHADHDSDPSELDRALDDFLDWAEETLHRHGEGAVGPGRVLGDFELIAPLGSGGMGVVWEAAQLSVPGRFVAVKVLRAELAGKASANRFRREVEAIGRLDHRAIVPVVSSGVDAGVPYYAMKSVAGTTLAQLLRRLREQGDVPRETSAARQHVVNAAGQASDFSDGGEASWAGEWPRWCAELVRELADALQHAHEHGVVHRDVKPANVLVTPAGRPVLVDFGLAATDTASVLTAADDFIGTLAYAAPEQVLGRSVDSRVDVWGLGVVLYELLTLSRPFDAPDRAALIEQLARGETPDPGPLAPGDLHTIVLTALAREPARRYASAGDLAHDLRAWIAGRAIRARPPSLARRVALRLRRHPRLVVASVTLLVVFGLARGRDHLRASGLAREADAARAEARAHDDQLLELQRRIDALLHPHGLRAAYTEHSRDLGELNAAADARRDARDRAQGRAEALYFDALATAGSHGGARDGLARLTLDARARALRAALDLRRPDEFGGLEDSLRRLADQGAPISLPTPGGQVLVAVEPPGAEVRVYADDPRTPLTERAAAAPLRVDAAPLRTRLPHGSYRATITAPGFHGVTVPFVVRPADAPRPAGTEADELAPWSRVDVRLHPAELVPPGWIHIPGGWSLVGNPPRWREVGDVVMQEREVTYADWLVYANAEQGRHSAGGQHPRFPGLPHLERDEQGRWRLRPDVVHDANWPVRGISRSDAFEYVAFHARNGAELPGYVLCLPEEDEYERAARGADGRSYPWGEAFRWDACAFAWSRDDPDAEPWPVPVLRFADDRSVFGVRDLAGSIAEFTRSSFAPRRDSVTVRGGSYLTGQAEALTAWTRREARNAPLSDVGFRMVQRPLPAWMTAAPPPPAPLVDDFERPDSAHAGGAWIEGTASPLQAPAHGGARERVHIDRGSLVLEGGRGNFSEGSKAWQRWNPMGDTWRLRARVRISSPVDGRTRGAQLVFVDERLRGAFGVQLFPDGHLGLSGSPGRPVHEVSAPQLAGHWLDIELLVERDALQVNAAVAGSSQPAVTRRVDFKRPHAGPFLELSAGNYHGVRLEVDSLELTSYD